MIFNTNMDAIAVYADVNASYSMYFDVCDGWAFLNRPEDRVQLTCPCPMMMNLLNEMDQRKRWKNFHASWCNGEYYFTYRLLRMLRWVRLELVVSVVALPLHLCGCDNVYLNSWPSQILCGIHDICAFQTRSMASSVISFCVRPYLGFS